MALNVYVPLPVPPVTASVVPVGYAVPWTSAGKEVVVTVRTDSKFSVKLCVADAPQKSVTVTLSVADMGVVELPVRTPALESWNPPGRLFVPRDHVSGAVPPVILKVLLYGVLTTPSGSGDVVVIAGAALQVTVSGPTVAVSDALSVTFRMTLAELAVHWPTIWLFELSWRPVGRPVAEKV